MNPNAKRWYELTEGGTSIDLIAETEPFSRFEIINAVSEYRAVVENKSIWKDDLNQKRAQETHQEVSPVGVKIPATKKVITTKKVETGETVVDYDENNRVVLVISSKNLKFLDSLSVLGHSKSDVVNRAISKYRSDLIKCL